MQLSPTTNCHFLYSCASIQYVEPHFKFSCSHAANCCMLHEKYCGPWHFTSQYNFQNEFSSALVAHKVFYFFLFTVHGEWMKGEGRGGEEVVQDGGRWLR